MREINKVKREISKDEHVALYYQVIGRLPHNKASALINAFTDAYIKGEAIHECTEIFHKRLKDAIKIDRLNPDDKYGIDQLIVGLAYVYNDIEGLDLDSISDTILQVVNIAQYGEEKELIDFNIMQKLKDLGLDNDDIISEIELMAVFIGRLCTVLRYGFLAY